MEIPIELFLGGIAVSIAIGIFGFIRNPQIPAMLCFGGAFVLLLSVSTTSILMDAFSSGLTDNLYFYNVESRTGTINLFTGSNIATVIHASASNSVIVGDTINCIDIYISKTGSPTGTASIGSLSPDNPPTVELLFGTQDVSVLTNSAVWKTYCLAGDNTYTIETLDRIGITYSGGDASNNININGDGNNPFDGVITFRQQHIGGAWSSSTGTDNSMRLYLSGGDFDITQNPYEFTELPKTFFALIGGTMILLGALMVIKE